jgi:hypothetical protein
MPQLPQFRGHGHREAEARGAKMHKIAQEESRPVSIAIRVLHTKPKGMKEDEDEDL